MFTDVVFHLNSGFTKILCTPIVHLYEGGATLQLSWTTNPNSWALTLFFELSAPFFGSKVLLDLYVPDFSKSTSEYLLFTKVVRKHKFRCFTAMYHFWMQCFKKILF